MKKQIAISILVLSAMLGLTGCKSNKKVNIDDIIGNETVAYSKNINNYELDEGIKRTYLDNYNKLHNINTGNTNNTKVEKETQKPVDVVVKSSKLAEITIKNEDKTTDFEISGNDIIYNGIKYINLNKWANTVEIPITKNGFINLIVKTIDITGATTVTIDGVCESDTHKGEEGTGYISIDENLSSLYSTYKEIKQAYGKATTWYITIKDKTNKVLYTTFYGCDKYLLYTGSKQAVTIDMNDYKENKTNENKNN